MLKNINKNQTGILQQNAKLKYQNIGTISTKTSFPYFPKLLKKQTK